MNHLPQAQMNLFQMMFILVHQIKLLSGKYIFFKNFKETFIIKTLLITVHLEVGDDRVVDHLFTPPYHAQIVQKIQFQKNLKIK